MNGFFSYFYKKLLGISVCLLILFLLFASIHIYSSHRLYLNDLAALQNNETQFLLYQEAETYLELNKLLELTAQRIIALKNKAYKIQDILNSIQRLSLSLRYPDIEKISYIKLSPPCKIITRFGEVALSPPLENSGAIKEIVFKEGKLTLQKILFNNKQEIEGIVRIDIGGEDFENFLGAQSSVSYSLTSTNIKNSYLRIYKNPPLALENFVIKHRSEYFIFLIYLLMSELVLIGMFFYLKRSFQKVYGESFTTMQVNIKENLDKISRLTTQFSTLSKYSEVQKLMHQAQKQLWEEILKNEKDNATYFYRSLKTACASLAKNNLAASEVIIEILNNRIKTSEEYLISTPLKLTHRVFSWKKFFESIQHIFADKIEQNQINFQIYNPDNCQIHGDPFILKIIFLNYLGKSIYRLPVNGSLTVLISSEQGAVRLSIKDNGFWLSSKQEELIKKKHIFFLEDKILKKFLAISGVKVISSSNALNQTPLTFIISDSRFVKKRNSNVVPLFS